MPRVPAAIEMVLCTCVVVLLGCGGAGTPPPPPPQTTTPAPSAAPRGAPLELLALKSTKDGAFGIAEGEVKNVSAGTLQDVIAVVSFLDKQGAVIVTAEAPIDSSALEAGKTSKFTVLTDQLKTELSTASVKFRLVGGTVLEVATPSPTR